MAKTAVFTIVSNNYAAYARVLMQSLRQSNPDYLRFVCLVDEPDGQEWGDVGGAEIVPARLIGVPDFSDMAFRYDVMELNTAVKPFMFRWLLEQRGFDRAIYLDPDILVFRPLEEVDRLLDEGNSAVLIPHVLRPLEDGARPDDHDILKSGVFNLGFAAMARVPETMDFIAWWGRKLRFHGYSDVRGNMFTDQRWCDFAPCLIEKLAILRHPGCNVAYWNLAGRTVEQAADNMLTVDGEPLVFFHFSGLRFEEPKLVSKHQDRLKWADLGAVRPLFEDYRQRLLDNGWDGSRKRPYAYGTVDGIRIVEPVRGLYRRRYPQHVPGDVLDGDFILRMCNQRVGRSDSPEGAVVTQLMMHVYESRPDLRAAFDLGRRDGLMAFLRWFEETPTREYGLDPRLTRQALIGRSRVAPLPDAMADPIPNAGRSLSYRLWRKARKRLLGLGVR